jgi:uncharacterized integral membrane protein
LSGRPRSAATVLRRVVAALILVPLGIVIIAFAVANRQTVTVSLDPFSASAPAASLTLPLFALIIVLLILGVVIGGIASWLGQARWRRASRRLERELDDLRGQFESLKRTAGAPAVMPQMPAAPEPLALRPPMR